MEVASHIRDLVSGLSKYLKDPVEVFDEFKDKTFIVFDTETTGLNHVKNQLTEVAAVAIKGPEFEVIDEFDEKVSLQEKTLKQIEEEKEQTAKDPKFFGVERVLKYNKYHSNPKDARDEDDVLKDFKAFCAKHGTPLLMGQNAKFDLSFIGHRIGKIPNSGVWDTKLFASYYLIPAIKTLSEKGVIKEQVRERLMTKKDTPSSSLEYILKSFAFKEKKLHTALTDVKSTVFAFKKIMDYFKRYVDVVKEEGYKKHQREEIVKEWERKKPKMKSLSSEVRRVALVFSKSKIRLERVGPHTFIDVNDPSEKIDSDDVQWNCPKCKAKYNEAGFDCECGEESPYEIVNAPKGVPLFKGVPPGKTVKKILHQLREAVGPLYHRMIPDKVYHSLPRPAENKPIEPTPLGSKEPIEVGDDLNFIHNGEIVVVKVKSISQSIKELAEEAAELAKGKHKTAGSMDKVVKIIQKIPGYEKLVKKAWPAVVKQYQEFKEGGLASESLLKDVMKYESLGRLGQVVEAGVQDMLVKGLVAILDFMKVSIEDVTKPETLNKVLQYLVMNRA